MFLIDQLQDTLNFEGCISNENYNTTKSIGRIGLTGYLIGLFGGIHLTIWIIFFIFDIQSPFCNALVIYTQIFLNQFELLQVKILIFREFGLNISFV